MTVPDTTPFTVLKGRPDEAETEAIGRALAVLLAEAADAASTSAGSDPREINRMRARTSSRGTWGTPAEQLAGRRNATGTFNPTGFRV